MGGGAEVEVGRGGMLEIAAFREMLTHDHDEWMRLLRRIHEEDDVSETDSGWPKVAYTYGTFPATGSARLRVEFPLFVSAPRPTLCGRHGLRFSLIRYFFVVLSFSFPSKRSLYH